MVPASWCIDALQRHLIAGRKFGHPGDPGLRAFVKLIESTPALRDCERRLLERHEAALAEAIAASSSPPVPLVAATALARFVLGALDLARDQPNYDQTLTGILDILRHGWPGS